MPFSRHPIAGYHLAVLAPKDDGVALDHPAVSPGAKPLAARTDRRTVPLAGTLLVDENSPRRTAKSREIAHVSRCTVNLIRTPMTLPPTGRWRAIRQPCCSRRPAFSSIAPLWTRTDAAASPDARWRSSRRRPGRADYPVVRYPLYASRARRWAFSRTGPGGQGHRAVLRRAITPSSIRASSPSAATCFAGHRTAMSALSRSQSYTSNPRGARRRSRRSSCCASPRFLATKAGQSRPGTAPGRHGRPKPPADRAARRRRFEALDPIRAVTGWRTVNPYSVQRRRPTPRRRRHRRWATHFFRNQVCSCRVPSFQPRPGRCRPITLRRAIPSR